MTQVQALSLDESIATVTDASFSDGVLDTVRYSPPYEHPARAPKRSRE